MTENSLEGSDWQLVTVGGAPTVAGSEATILFTVGKVSRLHRLQQVHRLLHSQVSGRDRVRADRHDDDGLSPAADAAGAGVPQGAGRRCGLRHFRGLLTLKGANGDELATFQPRKSVGLVGTMWSATGINNGKQAVVSLAAGV